MCGCEVMEYKYFDRVYSRLSFDEIKKRIETFSINSSSMSEDEVFDRIKDTVLFDFDLSRGVAFQAKARLYKTDSVFFRSRILQEGIQEFNHGDFWEPPSEFVNYGRLNQPKEQMLYLSNDVKTTLREIRNRDQQPVLLTVYKAIEDIDLFEMGFPIDDFVKGVVSEDTLLKMNMIRDFVFSLFIKEGFDSYKVSSRIAKLTGTLEFDGWVYPSVAGGEGDNMCLKLVAKDKLEVHSSFIIYEDKDGIYFSYSIELDDEINVFGFNKEDEKEKALEILHAAEAAIKESNKITNNAPDSIEMPIGIV